MQTSTVQTAYEYHRTHLRPTVLWTRTWEVTVVRPARPARDVSALLSVMYSVDRVSMPPRPSKEAMAEGPPTTRVDAVVILLKSAASVRPELWTVVRHEEPSEGTSESQWTGAH